MKIFNGLMDGQVLQRNKRGMGQARVSGSCSSGGDVEIRIMCAGKVLPGHDWEKAGAADAGRFNVLLDDLKTGGPYMVELRIGRGRRTGERLRIKDIFVGDVWILGGQSNMEGIGNLKHAPAPIAKVRAFYMRDEWGIAAEPVHFLAEAVDVFHNGYGSGPNRPAPEALAKIRTDRIKGVSPGHVFAIEMYKRTGIPQGLLACAHGGTSMAQWSPALRDKGGASLYGAMMRRYEKLGQPVAGMLWYQGESDANEQCAAVYSKKMAELVAATRRDMRLPQLPWLIVQLGCHAAMEDATSWNSIQEQQRRLPELIKNLDVAPAIDLELDDGIHIGGRGQHVLGRRLARIADRLVHRAPGVKGGIALKKVEMVRNTDCLPADAQQSVKLTYCNVAGRLVSCGRPAGFVLLDSAGRNIHGIYKTEISGNSVILHTNMIKIQLETFFVSYGHGRYPYCNITDAEGMSIPVMKAVPLPVDKNRMPELKNWETVLLRGAVSADEVSFAKASSARGWRKAPLRNLFGVLPKPPDDTTRGVFAMRTSFTADEALVALMVLGVNAPFKMWLNGSNVLSDLTCDIPIGPDKYKLRLALRKGTNELVAAFAPPGIGAHFGIYARIGKLTGKADDRIKV
jgi:hypothetical protein